MLCNSYRIMKKSYLIIVVIAIAIIGWAVVKKQSKPGYTVPEGIARPSLGPEDAKVVLEEWGDYQCPACGAAHPIVKKVLSEFEGKIRFIPRHYPLSIHPYSFDAARSAECANDQSKFFQMHNTMYENQKNLTKTDLKRYAKDIGLDTEKFSQCLDSSAHKDFVYQEQRDGDKKGLQGTPTFYLNGQLVDNWTNLATLIQVELDKTK